VRVVAIVQARCGSSRLPEKVLADVAGQPMFARVIQRVRQARTLTEIVLATTTGPRDDALVDLATRLNIRSFRGSEYDVLSRYAGAITALSPDVVLRLTADCPLLDAGVIDKVVSQFLRSDGVDYASNTLERTYPDGLDTEVISPHALIRAHLEAGLPDEREHVTSYIYRHPELFSLCSVTNNVDLSNYRFTVDEAADLAMVQHVYEHFQEADFTFLDVINFLTRHPHVRQINAHLA
jgi:spore coat polysaccharide biosynthesis protein SpsF